jgi:hypothetical protein
MQQAPNACKKPPKAADNAHLAVLIIDVNIHHQQRL